VDVARIDQLNIYWASLLAMREAIAQLVPALTISGGRGEG
jgi:hypothetical protein